ncbi:hypothetical protein [Nocardia sp. XZ_19_369]|uniref:hypothetical protein n=1 Tax=Nocardia sp. XZ_19_369 TaxID=2769487 RepID=UPI001E413085|nr:hypothetical protein [Nocardia sp. XZ_19_369]
MTVMPQSADRATRERTLQNFDSLAAYNAAYPDAALPAAADDRNALHHYDVGGAGVADDLVEPGSVLRIDFLPGGAPAPGEIDLSGTVVATRLAGDAVVVLAEGVSLRASWQTIRAQWPATLSGVRSALADARLYTGKP